MRKFLTGFYQPHCGDDDDDDGDEIVKLYTLFRGKCLFRPKKGMLHPGLSLQSERLRPCPHLSGHF